MATEGPDGLLYVQDQVRETLKHLSHLISYLKVLFAHLIKGVWSTYSPHIEMTRITASLPSCVY